MISFLLFNLLLINQFDNIYIYLFIYLFIYFFIYLFIYLFIITYRLYQQPLPRRSSFTGSERSFPHSLIAFDCRNDLKYTFTASCDMLAN